MLCLQWTLEVGGCEQRWRGAGHAHHAPCDEQETPENGGKSAAFGCGEVRLQPAPPGSAVLMARAGGELWCVEPTARLSQAGQPGMLQAWGGEGFNNTYGFSLSSCRWGRRMKCSAVLSRDAAAVTDTHCFQSVAWNVQQLVF